PSSSQAKVKNDAPSTDAAATARSRSPGSWVLQPTVWPARSRAQHWAAAIPSAWYTRHSIRSLPGLTVGPEARRARTSMTTGRFVDGPAHAEPMANEIATHSADPNPNMLFKLFTNCLRRGDQSKGRARRNHRQMRRGGQGAFTHCAAPAPIRQLRNAEI